MNIKALNQQMKSTYHAAGYTGKNIIFAVLDTGVEQTGGRVFGDGGDERDHGTFVASVLLGWCPDAVVWSYKITYPADVAPALKNVLKLAEANPGRRVIVNMSMSHDVDYKEIEDAINAVVQADVPFVCAAGNDGREVLDRYPTCYESPITVAALQQGGTRAYFSTYHNEVDFADFGQGVAGDGVDGKDVRSGTSYACPNLAGKIGLILCANPAMTESELYGSLTLCADDLGAEGRDPYTGYGFVRLPAPGAVATNEKREEEHMADRILKLTPKPRMQGDDVRELQTLLNGHGGHIEVDGIFGPATDTAVREFQADEGLTVDGIVGGKTWAALREEPGTPAKDYTELAADVTEWLRVMVGDHYIIGGQGHKLTRAYLQTRHEAQPEYFSNGRLEWLRAEIDRAESMGRNLYCEDCSGLFFKANEMIGLIPEKDMTANSLWKDYCDQIAFVDVRPLDILFRESDGKMVHMAVVGVDGVYEAAGTAYGVVFRPWGERFGRETHNRMTGKIDALKAWTHAGRLKL